MGEFRKRATTRVKFAVAILATGLLTAPVAVLASHHFTDVSNGHPFHKEIGVVADAGIARGFDDGTYRPSSNLTRQAMAAFLERGVGRAGFGQGRRLIGNDAGLPGIAVVAEASINAGAAGAGTTGFVVLTGHVHALTATTSACACQLAISLADNSVGVATTYIDVPPDADQAGVSRAIGSISTVLPIGGDEARSYQLVVQNLDASVGSIEVDGQLTALYVPLGPDGDDTLAYEHTCVNSETEPNNTAAMANSIGSGCAHGSIAGSDVDYFSLTVAGGYTLTLETRSVDGVGCAGNTKLSLTSASGGTIIEEDGDGGVGFCSRIVRSGLAGGPYRALVEAPSGNYAFNYRVTAILTPTYPAPGDDVEDAANE